MKKFVKKWSFSWKLCVFLVRNRGPNTGTLTFLAKPGKTAKTVIFSEFLAKMAFPIGIGKGFWTLLAEMSRKGHPGHHGPDWLTERPQTPYQSPWKMSKLLVFHEKCVNFRHFWVSGLSVTFFRFLLKSGILTLFHEILDILPKPMGKPDTSRTVKNRQNQRCPEGTLKTRKMAKNSKNGLFTKNYGD